MPTPKTAPAVKIAALEIENVKRVRAVACALTPDGLTVIGGRNRQGKTSVLDAIAWTLGGANFAPSNPAREEAEGDTATKLTLSNGITVERIGPEGKLKVTDPRTGKAGQALLNEFVSAFSLNLPRFLAATPTEKTNLLLGAYPGLGARMEALTAEAKRLYDERHALGVIETRKRKHAEDLPWNEGVPAEPLSAREVTEAIAAAGAVKAGNDAKRREERTASETANRAFNDAQRAAAAVEDLERRLVQARDEQQRREDLRLAAERAAAVAAKTVTLLQDPDTNALEQQVADMDETNAKVRENQAKTAARTEAEAIAEDYKAKTAALEDVRTRRTALLAGVKMPLPGLAIDEAGVLTYKGQPWDGMSGAEQLCAGAAICAAVKPECGFILLDRLETLDAETLADFGEYLEARGLQGIGTRVSTGEECTIIIEDGLVASRGRKE